MGKTCYLAVDCFHCVVYQTIEAMKQFNLAVEFPVVSLDCSTVRQIYYRKDCMRSFGEGYRFATTFPSLTYCTACCDTISEKSKQKGEKKVQGVPQLQTTALLRHQEGEETDKTKQAQIEQTYETHQD